MDLLKCLEAACPVCLGEVWAYRITRIYCNDSCKAIHHQTARKQIEDRVWVELQREREYLKLFSRNLYLVESVMGPEFNFMSVKLKAFQSHKFQLEECSNKKIVGGKTIYTLANYNYWLDGEILNVERVSDSPRYEYCVIGRWLLSFPNKSGRERFGVEKLAKFKKLFLDNGLVWRE